jgi:amidase
MDRTDYLKYDGLGLADLIRRREVSAAEVLAAAQAQIARINPAINAVVDQFDLPSEASEAADAPFLGVPFLLKDIGGALAGRRTSGACRYLLQAPAPAEDDALTARFKAAGLRILGKTNLPELGFNVTTEPALFGPTRNPWNLAHSAGGSSGGSAAAVAAGMVPLAHATDGAGSIRIPAACCGLIGLKPSRGALPQGPAHADIYGGLVSEGVVSRSIRDTAAALDAVYGVDAGAPYAAPRRSAGFLQQLAMRPPRLRIGINRQCLPDVVLAPEAIEAMDAAARALEDLGHQVIPVQLPVGPDDLAVPRQVYLAQVCAQAAADEVELHRLVGRPPRDDEMERINLAAAARGHEMGAAELLAAVRAGHAFVRRFATIWRSIDVLLTPALAGPPPRLGAFPTDHDDVTEHVARMLRFSPFTATFNLTGDPALTLPSTIGPAGLPLGIQLAASLGSDGTLLRLGAQLQEAFPVQSMIAEL